MSCRQTGRMSATGNSYELWFERKPHEAPSIGIVLCKDMNEAFVNLVIRNYKVRYTYVH